MLATEKICPGCGMPNRATAFLCGGCRHPLAGVRATPEGGVSAPTDAELDRYAQHHDDAAPSYARPILDATRDHFRLKHLVISLVLGIVCVVWGAMGGFGSMLFHFLGALVHEIGHAAWATFFGAPSFPVISLKGHAAAVHGGQFLWLAIAINAFFAYMAWTLRSEDKNWKPWAVLAVLYPAVAFTGLWHPLFLLAGHAGELTFAGIFMWRAWTGGFTSGLQERYLYAALAWYLAIHNVVFHVKLMFSAAYRAHYHTNGSFGLVNDYIRVAEGMGLSLPTVAGLMFVVNVVVLPIGIWLFIRHSSWFSQD